MPTSVDAIVSQSMGKLKSVKATAVGLVGIFKLLAEQHGEVAGLMKRVQADTSKRADLWPVIRKQLISHEKAEVRELYPVLRALPETRALADHHDDEARALEAMLGRLEALGLRSDAWGALFDAITETVIEHATEEENEIFPAAQEAIGEDKAQALEAPYLLAQRQIAMAL